MEKKGNLWVLEDQIDPIRFIQMISSLEKIENDPFYVVDLEDVYQKHVNWRKNFPRVEPHYAVKCNTDPMLLKLLAFLGTGFDCASQREIQKILDLDVSPDRIIFAHPIKSISSLKYAKEKRIDLITFDNENELFKMKEYHPNAKCVLRIKANDQNAIHRLSAKFGADMETSKYLIQKAFNLKLNLVGICFHVGCEQLSSEAFSESIQNSRTLFDFARENFNLKMNLLDIGGGFFGSSDSVDLFNSISKEINKSLEIHFPIDFFEKINGIGENKLKIISEPGTYFACSAFTLCLDIIGKCENSQTSEQKIDDEQNFSKIVSIQVKESNNQFNYDPSNVDLSKSIKYFLSSGVFGLLSCFRFSYVKKIFPILIQKNKTIKSKTLFKSIIWGPTCDGCDLIFEELYFPELNIGDLFVFKNMGSYTSEIACDFNSLHSSRCIYICSSSWKLKDEVIKLSDT